MRAKEVEQSSVSCEGQPVAKRRSHLAERALTPTTPINCTSSDLRPSSPNVKVMDVAEPTIAQPYGGKAILDHVVPLAVAGSNVALLALP